MSEFSGMDVLIIALAYVLVLFPASLLIKTVLKPWIDQIRQTASFLIGLT